MKTIILLLLIAAFCIACGGGAAPVTSAGPAVQIAAPPSGASFVEGETVGVQSSSADTAGVSRVELYVDGQLVDTQLASGGGSVAQFQVVQEWVASGIGSHTLSVRAVNSTGAAGQATLPILVNSRVALQPSPTPISAETSPATASCAPDAAFVSDVTIPPNTSVPAGQEFVKTWRIKNTGDCAWSDGFTLNYVNGDQLSLTTDVPLPQLAPGGTGDVSVTLRAPNTPGTVTSVWQARSPQGALFGPTLSVSIVVPDLPTPTPPILVFLPPFDGGMNLDMSFDVSGLTIRAQAHDSSVGQEDGDGIDHIDFFVQDLKGQVIASHRENNQPYCYFGDQNGECNFVNPGTNSFRWDDSHPIQPGWYLVRAVAHTPDERIQVREGAVHITVPYAGVEQTFMDLIFPGGDLIANKLVYQVDVGGIGAEPGIDHVDMFVVTFDGKIVSAQTEQNPNYCGFGDGGLNTPCTEYVFAEHELKWPDGSAVNRTQYILRSIAYIKDGTILPNSFKIQIDRLQ